jgi:hypothetical protein
VTYRRARVQLEQLEDRLVPAGLAPSALDQLLLEELNDARANPTAYGQSIGLDLSSVAPSQPLAFDPLLNAAAQYHSQDMNDRAYFDHVDPSGQGPGDRITAQGYSWTSWGESIAAGFTSTASALSGLIIDNGVPDLGHRRHLLAIDQMFKTQSEVGIGIVMNGSGPYHDYYTIDTAAPTDSRPFLTGVVFNDTNGNGKYDIGEGLGGVTITVQGAGSTTTWASGGYSLQLNPGTYTVIVSGGGLATPYTQVVTIGSQNVRLNVVQASQAVQQANSAFVTQTFQSLLKRSPSASDVSVYTNALNTGTLTQAQLVSLVRSSTEYTQVCTVWLTETYKVVLGRTPGSAELSGWLSWLQTTGTEDQLAAVINNSAEAHQHVWAGWIQDAFQTYLGRSAGPADIASWTGAFQIGWSRDTFVATVLSSVEYQNRVGASNTQFVTALYRDVLGRTASTTDVNAWAGLLQGGTSRAAVIAAFVGSFEYQWRKDMLWGASLYQNWLGRPASATELSAVAGSLTNGTPDTLWQLTVLDSIEFYAHALNG